ncbi:hypothetical protein AXE65_05470 [Ventosimonas gracilis]|uniref:dTDP-4-dehydrorhamnose reductase n=1 Tax=Ventosimonas gracilis TaxID=1680762 RepID=A0A139SNL2_9GAMM|nr:dTDP-4-dehydrorhamnose reductase [Ventosimonas gracilis]KXU36167.1 hypothetical protein AXE65_05470 [Ventosimonas gracilis]
MRVLLVGASGQLGFEVKRQMQAGFTLMLPSSRQLDIRSAEQVAKALRELKPDLIINAAAFTAVDQAEQEPEQAFAVNERGVKHLAQSNLPIVHLSTDYVFNGELQRPYREEDKPAPLNSYGQSKLAGEKALTAVNPRHLILRTGGLFGVHGNNFVKAILYKAQNRQLLTVVNDQFSTPTPAPALAKAIGQLAKHYREQAKLPWGIYHFGGQPAVSWYEFAVTIAEQALILGLLKQRPEIIAIKSADYPGAVCRPRYSALDSGLLQRSLGLSPPDWRDGLRQMLAQLA